MRSRDPRWEEFLVRKYSRRTNAEFWTTSLSACLWNKAQPFYGDQVGAHKALQSRGTESVLNALILATFDARNGSLGMDTRAAFRNMWALQQTTGDERGAWPWLDFGLEPFEANDSVFYGAALAAIGVGTAPDNYRESPEIQGYLKLMRDYC
jgi:hypothetical protein